LISWISLVDAALVETLGKYPFLAYGTDWLAFAHIVIAIAFVGPLRDPVRNVWVVQYGLLCCGLVLVFSAIVPHLRGLPWFWMFVDGSFGIAGAIPLLVILRDIRRLERSDTGAAVARPA
jgi:hypothetical protein